MAKIFVVSDEYKSDVKCFKVDDEYKADLLVYVVNDEYKATSDDNPNSAIVFQNNRCSPSHYRNEGGQGCLLGLEWGQETIGVTS